MQREATDAAHVDVVTAWTVVRGDGGGWRLIELEVPVDQARIVSRTEPDPMGLIMGRLEDAVQRRVQRDG